MYSHFRKKNIGFLYDGNLVTAEIDLLDPNKTIIRNYTWGLDPAGTTQQVGGIGALLETEVVNQDNAVLRLITTSSMTPVVMS
jgi:hypothetical protein